MAYSRFFRNPFGAFGSNESYEPITVETSEVKVEEKKEEKKEGPKCVNWGELTIEEQERAIQFFLEYKTLLSRSCSNLKACLLTGFPLAIFFNGGLSPRFYFDNNKYIGLTMAFPYILKHLNIKKSWVISLFADSKNRWYYSVSPVIAPAP